jgi:PAS domain-containing protein
LTFSSIDLIISLVIFIGVILIKYRFMAIEKITEKLRQSEERYALAAQGANDGLWDCDLISGKLYLSPRWKHTLGYEDRDLVNSVIYHTPSDCFQFDYSIFLKAS